MFAMYNCPTCRIPLKRNSGLFGVSWICPACSGKGVSLSILRKAVPNPVVNEFWRKVKSQEYSRKRRCPACKSPMSEVPVLKKEKDIYLDVCETCYFIWLDANEFESLPKNEISGAKEKEQLPLKARKALAKLEIESLANKQRKENKVNDRLWQEGIELLIDAALIAFFSSI